jgi:hypothetical protein
MFLTENWLFIRNRVLHLQAFFKLNIHTFYRHLLREKKYQI